MLLWLIYNARKIHLAKSAGNRSFGLLIGAVFAAIAALHYWAGSGFVMWLTVATIFLLVAWLMPRVLAPLKRLWLKFGQVLSLVISPIVLGLIYVTAIIPVGLLIRLFGKDLLSLKHSSAASSYWIKRDAGTLTPQSLKDQF